jgi:PAS domain S-box-containing protein
MAEMLIYKPEEMIGRFIWDFAYEEDKDIFQIKLANRKQGIDEVYELKLIRKDGSPLWVSVSAKGFFDDAGKFEGSVGMFTDITDRKRAEEALRESKARVESIFRSSPVGIGVVVDRMIKEANERLCEMKGYSREELLGKSAMMLYPTAVEYERVGWVKYGMITERGTGYVETHWQRKDGSVVDILLSSSPIIPGDLSGEITFISLDVTERKHAEEALKKAHNTLEEKVKERTAELEKAYNSLKESEKSLANIQIARQKEIHHRIKNNLQVISSLLDLQSEKFRNRECVEEAEVLKAFRESQDRVMSIALIHEELHEGRGTDTLNFSTYLERLVKDLFQTYRLGNTNTSLKIELEEDIFFDMDIAVSLGIIINELVSNSLKYAFPGKNKGEIQIKLCRGKPTEYGDRKSESEEEGYNDINFILTVSYNGIGIPEGFNSEDSGSLGLQLVAILVDQLDGELELKRNNGSNYSASPKPVG